MPLYNIVRASRDFSFNLGNWSSFIQMAEDNIFQNISFERRNIMTRRSCTRLAYTSLSMKCAWHRHQRHRVLLPSRRNDYLETCHYSVEAAKASRGLRPRIYSRPARDIRRRCEWVRAQLDGIREYASTDAIMTLLMSLMGPGINICIVSTIMNVAGNGLARDCRGILYSAFLLGIFMGSIHLDGDLTINLSRPAELWLASGRTCFCS